MFTPEKLFLSFWCFTTLSAVAGYPWEKGPGASLHRTATHMYLKESGAVLLASHQPQGRTCSPSPAAVLVAHISALADAPALGIGRSLQILVHTPLQVHVRYVTSRAINVLHAGYLIRGDRTHPISSPTGTSRSHHDRACPHRRSVKILKVPCK